MLEKNNSMLFCANHHNFNDFVCIFQKCQVTNKTGAAGSSALKYPQSWFVFSSRFWLIIETQHKNIFIYSVMFILKLKS